MKNNYFSFKMTPHSIGFGRIRINVLSQQCDFLPFFLKNVNCAKLHISPYLIDYDATCNRLAYVAMVIICLATDI